MHGVAADMTKRGRCRPRRSTRSAPSITSCRRPVRRRPDDPIGDIDIDATRRFIDNKLIGAVMLAKHASRSLEAWRLDDLHVGHQQGQAAGPGGCGRRGHRRFVRRYFARALALELGPTRVNVVSPGWVDTPMFDEIVGDAKAGYFEDWPPACRQAGSPRPPTSPPPTSI